jgi:WD40 repeat protein
MTDDYVPTHKVLFLPKLQAYLSASRDNTVKLWTMDTDRHRVEYNIHSLVVNGISSNPGSYQRHFLFFSSCSGNVFFFDRFEDNTLMMSGSRDNSLILWDTQTGNALLNSHINRNLVGHHHRHCVFRRKKKRICLAKVTDLNWSSDGKLLIQSGEDKEIRIWDPLTLKLIHSFPKKQYIQTSCQFNSDATLAISTSNGFQGNGCEVTVSASKYYHYNY